MRQSISRDEFNRCMGFINILKDYEQIGDIVEKNIIYLAESKYANNIHFSEEGQKELSMMADKIKQMIHVVNAALVTNSCYLAEKAKKMYEEIEELEFRIRMIHFARLKEGIKCTGNVTPVFLDIINSYLRIAGHLKDIAVSLTDEVSCTWHAELELIYGPDENLKIKPDSK